MVFPLYVCKTHPAPVCQLILVFNCGSFEVQEVKFPLIMLCWCGNNYLSCFKLSVPTENRGSNPYAPHPQAQIHSNPDTGMSNMLLWSNLHSMWVAAGSSSANARRKNPLDTVCCRLCGPHVNYSLL